MRKTEVWQRGTVSGFDPYVLPVAHSLLQVKEDLDDLAARVREELVWERPGGAASIGFHIRHIGGATDRLLTYARGEALNDSQLAAARSEATGGEPLRAVVAAAQAALDRALEQVRTTPHDSLLTERKVGRAGLPSTTLGLFVHVAEHSARHVGQAVTTAKIAGALGEAG